MLLLIWVGLIKISPHLLELRCYLHLQVLIQPCWFIASSAWFLLLSYGSCCALRNMRRKGKENGGKRKKRKKRGKTEKRMDSTAAYLSRAGGPRPLSTQYSKWDFMRSEGWMLRILRNNWCFWLTVNERALDFSYWNISCFFTIKGNNLHLSVYRKYNIKVQSVLNVFCLLYWISEKKKWI